MPHPDFIILYVDDATASARFYGDLLGRSPVEASPGFALFVLDSGIKLGLWSRGGVVPPAAAGSGAEVVFTVDHADAVRATHADWRRRGLTIALAPTAMEFGHTFVALDPNGHRLRVYAPSAP